MTLFPFEKRWAAAILEGFAPCDGPGLAPKPAEVDWLGVHLRIFAATAPVGKLSLRLGVIITALAPLWLQGRPALISSLEPLERSRLLGRLLRLRGPAGELANLLKMSASIALLGTPSVRARSGFDRIPHAGL